MSLSWHRSSIHSGWNRKLRVHNRSHQNQAKIVHWEWCEAFKSQSLPPVTYFIQHGQTSQTYIESTVSWGPGIQMFREEQNTFITYLNRNYEGCVVQSTTLPYNAFQEDSKEQYKRARWKIREMIISLFP